MTFLKHEKKNFMRRIQTLSLASFPESSQEILAGFATLGYDISQQKNFMRRLLSLPSASFPESSQYRSFHSSL
jgi:hypothetical protein